MLWGETGFSLLGDHCYPVLPEKKAKLWPLRLPFKCYNSSSLSYSAQKIIHMFDTELIILKILKKGQYYTATFLNICIHHATNNKKNKTNESIMKHYWTEWIKTCMFLTVRGKANKAELFLEPRKKKTHAVRIGGAKTHAKCAHAPIQAVIKLHQWGK